MSILCQDLKIHCRWVTEARLPDYAGSALRGAFGWALKKSSCALRRQDCTACLLRQRCAYAWIFETERYTDANSRPVNVRPHPFVVRPGIGCAGSGKEGEAWEFSMLLIGEGGEYLPHIVYSIRLMGESGIGSSKRNGLGRFQLERIVAGTNVIYDGSSGMLLNNNPVAELCMGEQGQRRETKRIRIHFHTPLRLKYNNGLLRDLPFHVLIRACLRRISSLEEVYGQGEPKLDYIGLINRAERVQTVTSTLRWQEMLRYSNRQKQKTSLSGLVGVVEYRGDLTEYLNLLEYCGLVHIGKQTVFGLGWMSVQRLDEDNSIDN
nr:CRISPR system precrRNA processing endoribonuclease RAMP protein Cas6 [uncultured Desulfobulbus sp.]